MPAVVRGGRRQAKPAPETKGAPAKTAGGAKPRSRKGGGAPAGKYRVIGSVPVSNELVIWFAVFVVAALMTVILATGSRAQAVANAARGFADDRIAAFGLNLQNVRLIGVSDVANADVRKALPFHRGQPLALMDIAKVEADIENVGWVKSATVRRQFPGTLIVTVVERPRLAVWQYQGKDTVIDDQGQVIPEASARKFLDLPLVVGEGANEAAGDILQLMQTRPELMQKTYAFQRVDTRRWNILLKNGAVIKLPALGQDQALNRLDALMNQQHVLDQGFAEIDLLDPNALVVVPLEAHTPAASTQPSA